MHGFVAGRAGDETTARETLTHLQTESARRYVSPALLARVHLGLGEVEPALTRLEEAVDRHAVELIWLARRPEYAVLKNEPRYAALLEQLRLN